MAEKKKQHSRRTYSVRLVANREQMNKLNEILRTCDKGVAARMTKSEALAAILSDALNRCSTDSLVGVVNAADRAARESIANEKRAILIARQEKIVLAAQTRIEELRRESTSAHREV